jgi:hypothetical protein
MLCTWGISDGFLLLYVFHLLQWYHDIISIPLAVLSVCIHITIYREKGSDERQLATTLHGDSYLLFLLCLVLTVICR